MKEKIMTAQIGLPASDGTPQVVSGPNTSYLPSGRRKKVDETVALAKSILLDPPNLTLRVPKPMVWARIVNDDIRNEARKALIQDIRNERRRLRLAYRGAYSEWKGMFNAQKAYLKAKLKEKKSYDKYYYFDFNYVFGDLDHIPPLQEVPISIKALDTMDSVSVSQRKHFVDRGWHWVSIDMLHRVITRVASRDFGTQLSRESRMVRALATIQAIEYRFIREQFRILFGTDTTIRHGKLVAKRRGRRVEARPQLRGAWVRERVVLRSRKGKYARSELYSILAGWLEAHPPPKQPEDSEQLLKKRIQVNEHIMFHTCAASKALDAVSVPKIAMHCPAGSRQLVNAYDGFGALNHDQWPIYRGALQWFERRSNSGPVSHAYEFGATDVAPQTISYRTAGPIHRYISADLNQPIIAAIDDSSNIVPIEQAPILTQEAGLHRSVLDLEDLRIGKTDQFNLLRSSLELKDVPETIKVLRQVGSYSAALRRYGEGAVKLVERSPLVGNYTKGTLAFLIAVHLAWKFGIAPTASDVKQVMDKGLKWATSMRRSLRKMINGTMEIIHRVTFRHACVGPKFSSKPIRQSRFRYPSGLPWNRINVLTHREFGGYTPFPDSLTYSFQGESLKLQDSGYVSGLGHAILGHLSDRQWYDTLMSIITTLDPAPVSYRPTIARLCQANVFGRFEADVLMRALGVTDMLQLFDAFEPLTVAWELVPLSFVVDWITTSHDVISNLQRKIGAAISGISTNEQGPWMNLRVTSFIEQTLSVSVGDVIPEVDLDLHSMWLGYFQQPSSGWVYGNDRTSAFDMLHVSDVPDFRSSMHQAMLRTFQNIGTSYSAFMANPQYSNCILMLFLLYGGLRWRYNAPVSTDMLESFVPIRRDYWRFPLDREDFISHAGSLESFRIQSKLNLSKLFTLGELLVQALA